jgi:hypothetical protein
LADGVKQTESGQAAQASFAVITPNKARLVASF